MKNLLHIRISSELKKQMQELVGAGLFSSQGEIVREGIRDLLLKYEKTLQSMKKRK